MIEYGGKTKRNVYEWQHHPLHVIDGCVVVMMMMMRTYRSFGSFACSPNTI